MPRSKRARPVALRGAEKKHRAGKETLYAGIRGCLDEFVYVWVFSVDNMRNTYLKQVRHEWSDSRIFFGRTKVMAKALGASVEEEYKENLHELSTHLAGNVGLLFTNHAPPKVKEFFASFVKIDYARAGLVAPITVTVPEGLVYSRGGDIPVEEDVPISHSFEAFLRQSGMPTRLANGKVMLDTEYTICTAGEPLDSRASRLLKTFGIAVSDFKVALVAYWDANTAKVTVVDEDVMQ